MRSVKFRTLKTMLDISDESVAEYRRMTKSDFDNGKRNGDDSRCLARTSGEALVVSSDGATKSRAVAYLDALIGKEVVNVKTRIKAKIYTNQRNKIVSKAAINKSKANGFNDEQHFAVASCIDT